MKQHHVHVSSRDDNDFNFPLTAPVVSSISTALFHEGLTPLDDTHGYTYTPKDAATDRARPAAAIANLLHMASQNPATLTAVKVEAVEFAADALAAVPDNFKQFAQLALAASKYPGLLAGFTPEMIAQAVKAVEPALLSKEANVIQTYGSSIKKAPRESFADLATAIAKEPRLRAGLDAKRVATVMREASEDAADAANKHYSSYGVSHDLTAQSQTAARLIAFAQHDAAITQLVSHSTVAQTTATLFVHGSVTESERLRRNQHHQSDRMAPDGRDTFLAARAFAESMKNAPATWQDAMACGASSYMTRRPEKGAGHVIAAYPYLMDEKHFNAMCQHTDNPAYAIECLARAEHLWDAMVPVVTEVAKKAATEPRGFEAVDALANWNEPRGEKSVGQAVRDVVIHSVQRAGTKNDIGRLIKLFSRLPENNTLSHYMDRALEEDDACFVMESAYSKNGAFKQVLPRDSKGHPDVHHIGILFRACGDMIVGVDEYIRDEKKDKPAVAIKTLADLNVPSIYAPLQPALRVMLEQITNTPHGIPDFGKQAAVNALA